MHFTCEFFCFFSILFIYFHIQPLLLLFDEGTRYQIHYIETKQSQNYHSSVSIFSEYCLRGIPLTSKPSATKQISRQCERPKQVKRRNRLKMNYTKTSGHQIRCISFILILSNGHIECRKQLVLFFSMQQTPQADGFMCICFHLLHCKRNHIIKM